MLRKLVEKLDANGVELAPLTQALQEWEIELDEEETEKGE
jgi:hypothetical protein